jgi:type I restriction enzyme, R subunit
MTSFLKEGDVENQALSWFEEIGYTSINGTLIAPDSTAPERDDFSQVILKERLKRAIDNLNPDLPEDAKQEVIKKIQRADSQKLIENNKQIYKYLTEGITVQSRINGNLKWVKVNLIDFNNIANNEFLAINQFTIKEGEHTRRPDIILFVNGIPIVLIELKNPSDESADIQKAFNQLQTYKQQIPTLFNYNQILVVSDGTDTRVGTISSNIDRFMIWKTIYKEEASFLTQLEVLIRGMLNKETLLDLINNFIVYEADKDKTIKKISAYHQYNATNNAVASTIKAVKGKDKRAGVVWHTQGSGKSLTMLFYSGKVIQQLNNPTLLVLTDRNELDDQLFNTFSKCRDVLRQEPKQAEDRENIKKLLNVASGGVIFSTIQKFSPDNKGEVYPKLSDRENIIVIVDEAHRSQYGFLEGFAKNLRDALPNATYVGFTGTPIDKHDKSTKNVFGEYVDVYDISKAVEDKMTVPIYYESRLAKISLNPESQITLDKDFEYVTETEEKDTKEQLKSKWARIEKIIGHPERVKEIAKDIVNHFQERDFGMPGKGIIVCMSRRICVDMYNEIIKLKPEWHNDDDKKGYLKVIMTGNATDPLDWQKHIRNSEKRREIGDIYKDPSSETKLVIVRDMWLTGFDVPSLHTMYIDKPMKDHNLMQAIARVNRVFGDKQGGLIVDYISILTQLKEALGNYSLSDQKKVGITQEEAVNLLLNKYDVVKSLLYKFEYDLENKDTNYRMKLLINAMEHILKQEDGKKRFIDATVNLLRAFSLAVPDKKALDLKEEIAFFQAIKSQFVKNTVTRNISQTELLEQNLNQLISKSIMSSGIMDVLKVAGLKRPDISILSEEFMLEIKNLPQKNLALEMYRKLLNDEIKSRFRKNVIKQRSFKEMIENIIKLYTNRSITTIEVIEELLKIAREIKASEKKGEELDLSEDEVAFYDALSNNKSAISVLGDKQLVVIAKILADTIKKNTNSVDWEIRETERANIRKLVKRILNKYGYPPDMQDEAVKLVLEQAEKICKEGIDD